MMNWNKAATITGILKFVTGATGTIHLAQDEISWWVGMVLSVLMGVSGYISNQPEKPIPPAS